MKKLPSLSPQEIAERMAENCAAWVYKGKGSQSVIITPPELERLGNIKVVKELKTILIPKFLPLAKRLLDKSESNYFNDVKNTCKRWANQKFNLPPDTFTHLESQITHLSFSVLREFPAPDMVETLEILKNVTKVRRKGLPSPKDFQTLERLMKKFKFPKNIERQIFTIARRKITDPILKLLDNFFSAHDGYWKNYFNKTGSIKTTKIPWLRETMTALYEAYRDPKRHLTQNVTLAKGLPLTAKEGYDLTSQVLKAVYPNRYSDLTADAVKSSIQYHRAKLLRPSKSQPSNG